jgi:hypothetical protein
MEEAKQYAVETTLAGGTRLGSNTPKQQSPLSMALEAVDGQLDGLAMLVNTLEGRLASISNMPPTDNANSLQDTPPMSEVVNHVFNQNQRLTYLNDRVQTLIDSLEI